MNKPLPVLCDMLADKTMLLLKLIEVKDHGPMFQQLKNEVVQLQTAIRELTEPVAPSENIKGSRQR